MAPVASQERTSRDHQAITQKFKSEKDSRNMKSKQIPFSSKILNCSLTHGGELRKKRKGRGARPLSKKDPIHLVLKSTLALKQWNFRLPKNHQIISKLIYKLSVTYGIKIDQKAIAYDHIHLLVRVKNRELYKRFIKHLAGQIAQLVTDARSESSSLKKQALQFFKHRPFTRIVKGWRDFLKAKDYVKLNEQEAMGNIPHRRHRLAGLEPHEYHHIWS
jgi:REP element-mobilizing transposase RayT